jgi:hypothetical protein
MESIMAGEQLYAHGTTPREFYDYTLSQTETKSSAFVALSLNNSVGAAYNFFKGYVEHLEEQEEMAGKDAHRVAEGNIRTAAGFCISGYEKDGKTPTEQLQTVLGEWPKVFDAIQVELEAQAALEQTD